MADLSMHIGVLHLKNPLIAGSSELTMSETGIRACLEAGAAAVVAKSVNEAPEAARQLETADYVLLDDQWQPVPWEDASGVDETLFCRSGLPGKDLDEWTAMLARCDADAEDLDALVVGSITVGHPSEAPRLARRLGEAVRVIELNLSAPHGREAASGAIHLATDPEGVADCVRQVRKAVDAPLIVKLTAQSADVVGLAQAAVDAGADAVSLTGRSLGFLPDPETWDPVLGSWGAIGGRWALPLTLYWISKAHLALPSTPLLATNGVRTGSDVVRALLAGASGVELASVLLTKGPGYLREILAELRSFLEAHRLQDLTDLVGISARRALSYQELSPTPEDQRIWPWLPYQSE